MKEEEEKGRFGYVLFKFISIIDIWLLYISNSKIVHF